MVLKQLKNWAERFAKIADDREEVKRLILEFREKHSPDAEGDALITEIEKTKNGDEIRKLARELNEKDLDAQTQNHFNALTNG